MVPIKTKDREPFRLIPIAILLALLGNLYLTWQSSLLNRKAIANPHSIYVQSQYGKVLKASSVNSLYRSDSVISSFVLDWLKLAYTWKIKDDFIKENRIVYPKQLYKASIAIAPNFRETYLKEIAKKYQKKFPFKNYISGANQSYVRVFTRPKVDEVEPGVWDVTVIATRTHAQGNRIIENEYFNHVIRVRAIFSQDESRLWGNKDTHLGMLFNQMQLQGLQIISIKEI